MKKNYRNKAIEEGQESTKAKKLICLRECEMPGVGLFKKDQVIEDEDLISKIDDNPNFEPTEE